MSRYVAWEWNRARYIFEEYRPWVEDARVLEFGSYLGATAIVLAWGGARVVAVDVDLQYLTWARLNVRRYGVEDRVSVLAIPKAPQLPFPDHAFDLVVCNSVLEYVPSPVREATLKELDRVLRRGGLVIVLGTSNRLWARELHSRRWFVNYVPGRLRRRFNIGVIGVSPLSLRRPFVTYADLTLLDRGQAFLRAKRRRGVIPWKLACLWCVGRILAPANISVGMLTHAVSLVLQKR
jgi:SAM-dependent methyltransferase